MREAYANRALLEEKGANGIARAYEFSYDAVGVQLKEALSVHEERHWSELREESVKDFLARKFNVPLVKPHPDAVNHAAYLKAIDSAKAVVCTGPAGTGKTYMACGKAVEYLRPGGSSASSSPGPSRSAGRDGATSPATCTRRSST
jgi:phosphate starvation-inducible protein PhoH